MRQRMMLGASRSNDHEDASVVSGWPSSSSSTSPASRSPAPTMLPDGGPEPDLLGDDDEPGDNAARAAEDDLSSLDGILDEDPIDGRLRAAPLSFKRKQGRRPSWMSAPSRLFAAFTGSSSSRPETMPRPHRTEALPLSHSPDRRLRESVGLAAKDGFPVDWHVEGPGRRVGYDDLTAIDWIFEYTKERQRQRVLSSTATGLLGYLQRLLDASQVWVVLILTGLMVGAIAAGIDVATNWLADLKLGFCSSGPEGGHWYLNKKFCCYGYDKGSKCAGWKPWSEALGIQAAGGKWAIEYLFYILFSVTLATCAAVLVQEYAVFAKHSGIPEIKTVLGGFVIRRFLGTWTLITKSLGLVLAVSSGMWLGKEGPLVHVACCCANLLIKLFGNISGNEARKREILSAAAAAGISVAFGSPIGGVLFSLEQLSYYFPDKTMWQSFVCAMTAAVTLQAFDPFRSGKLVLFQTKYDTDWWGFEIIPHILLGVFGGIYGGLFIKANMAVARWKKASGWLPGPITQVLMVALLTALINYPNFYMKVQTSELVSHLLADCSRLLDDQMGLCNKGAASASTMVLLMLAAVVGFFLAAITFGLQIPAGIILPSMAIGALTGRTVGILMEIWVASQPSLFLFASCGPDVACIAPGTYAIIGAAAALAGVTRLTVSIVVIMFELTGALDYVLPIMVAVMVSKWVGDAFSRRGIYESWIHLYEYPFLDNGLEAVAVPEASAAQMMTRIEDLVVITATGHTMASLAAMLDMHPYRGFPVISDPREAILLGYISRADLRHTLAAASRPPRSLGPDSDVYFAHQPLADARSSLDLRPWMDQTPLCLASGARLHLVVSYFQELGLRYVLFTDRGVLQGLLTKKDVWYLLNGADDGRRPASVVATATAAAASAATMTNTTATATTTTTTTSSTIRSSSSSGDDAAIAHASETPARPSSPRPTHRRSTNDGPLLGLGSPGPPSGTGRRRELPRGTPSPSNLL